VPERLRGENALNFPLDMKPGAEQFQSHEYEKTSMLYVVHHHHRSLLRLREKGFESCGGKQLPQGAGEKAGTAA
jgi:hypothetical protein